MAADNIAGLFSFMQKAENLKNTLRSGCTSTGRRESSAEHSWRLGLLLLVVARNFDGIDEAKLLKLAVIHDLGEAISGDIPAPLQSATSNKAQAERAGMLELCSSLPESVRKDILALWDEYEQGETLEAKVVKGFDKIETLMQHNQGQNPPGFNYSFNLSYAKDHTNYHPLLAQIREEVDKATRLKAGV